jgi:hypothetical protein
MRIRGRDRHRTEGIHTNVNKRRRVEDRYHALRIQSHLWTAMRLALVLFPALLAVGIGYALGPYIGPLF